jgi:hypothetical protein
VLDYVKRFVPYLPRETISYDDASNNKAYVAGAAALIWNPPSAWAVAKRDAPADRSRHLALSNPKGKMGRLVPHRPYFWGIWQWAQNKSAAKDLLAFISQRDIVTKLSIPAAGYDIPPFLSMADLPVWADIEPPKGTLYNYPCALTMRPSTTSSARARRRHRRADLEPLDDPGDGGTHLDRSTCEEGDRLGERELEGIRR